MDGSIDMHAGGWIDRCAWLCVYALFPSRLYASCHLDYLCILCSNVLSRYYHQIVAVVVKYADNVLKGFATSLSILISSVVSFYFFHDIEVNFQFIEGAIIVLSSVFIYGSADSSSGRSVVTTGGNPAGLKK